MIRFLLFVFRISPKTLGKQIVVYHWELTVLRCSSGTVATWSVLQKKRRSAFSTNNFCWIWLKADLIWRPTRWTIALFRAHTHSCMIRQLWRSYIRLLRHRHRILPTFLYTNRHEPFLSDSGIQREQALFMASCSFNIECVLLAEMPRDGSISRYVTWRSCIIISRTTLMSFTELFFEREMVKIEFSFKHLKI